MVAFALVGVMVAWDFYLTFAGLKVEFSYTTVPIDNYLFEDVDEHFRNDPKFSSYQIEAEEINSIEEFN